jgi:hypothetical protein
VRPLLFQDRDQDQVQFIQECTFGTELLFGAGVLDDKIDDEVPDTCGSNRPRSARAPRHVHIGYIPNYLGIVLSVEPSTES